MAIARRRDRSDTAVLRVAIRPPPAILARFQLHPLRGAARALHTSGRTQAHMANIKSQIKRNRQNEVRRLRNKAVSSELKTRVKNAVKAAETGADDVVERQRQAQKRIDMAAAKGVIHKNAAARRKSRLAKRIARE